MSQAIRDRSGVLSGSEDANEPPASVLAPRLRRWSLRAPIALAGALVVGLAAGFVAFANGIVTATPPADPKAAGIVVLTGGSARIDNALHLLAEGRARRLLISGVNPSVGTDAIAGTVGPGLDPVLSCCVDLGHDARDTIGNALETRDWATEHGYASLIVVTSDYHMPRSLAELADTMPNVRLIPYPISNPELHLAEWWSNPEAFWLLSREYGKYLLAAARLALAPLSSHLRPGSEESPRPQ